MKKIVSSFIILLYISLMSGACLSAPPKGYEAKWEYVFSEIPCSYYVDMNRHHILMPTKDIFVFYVGDLNSDIDIFTARQWSIRSSSDGGFEGRIENSIKMNTKTRKIFGRIDTPTSWIKIEYNSPIYKCMKYAYDHANDKR